jgi:hypothetical protein
LRYAKGRSLLRNHASTEAATALEKWEAEGGAGVLRPSESDATAPLDRFLLERLGTALIGEWSNLPVRLQRAVYERAVSVSSPSNRPAIRRQMARFLHLNQHKSRPQMT